MAKIQSPFLNLSSACIAINKRYKLTDSKEVRILEATLLAYLEGVEYNVKNLIFESEIASQATMHSLMKALIYKQLIKSETSKEDGRRKFLSPTKQGIRWLEECTKALHLSAKK